MKRLLLSVLACLLLAAPALSFDWACQDGEPWQLARMNPAFLGSGGGPVYTDCSNIGTASFYWNGDHADGETKGCKNSTTTVTGTLSNATIVASGTTPGTISPDSGGKCLLSDSASDTFAFTITDLVDLTGAEGAYEADVYIGDASGVNTLLLIYQGSANRISLQINANNTISLDHTGNGVQVYVASTDTIPENTWTKVYARWKANDKMSVKIGSGNWKDDVDADEVTAFSSNATLLRVLNSGPDTFYIDNIRLYTSSGY